MSIFDEVRQIKKDTVCVDMKQRWTPQIVKFVNNNNEFFGYFDGRVNITNGTISNTMLSNISIYKPNGDLLDIDTIIDMSDKFDDYDIQFLTLSNIVNTSLPSEITSKFEQLSTLIDKKISDTKTQINLSQQLGNKELSGVIDDVKTTISNIENTISKDLSTEISNRIEGDNLINIQISSIQEDVSNLSNDYISSKMKYDSDINWIFNRISCVVNYMGVLNLTNLKTPTLKDVFFINQIANVPLSNGWFYMLSSATEYKDYHYINGVKLGNGDFIKIINNLSSVNDIELSDVVITDIMDSDVVHQAQLDAMSLSVSLLSTILSNEISSRISYDSILTNQCEELTQKIETEKSERITHDKELSGWYDDIAANLEQENENRVINDATLSNLILSEQSTRENIDKALSVYVDTLSSEVQSINNNIETLSSDYHMFIDSTFTSISNDNHDSEIKNLCIVEQDHPHNKHYLTFKNGTLVLIKTK